MDTLSAIKAYQQQMNRMQNATSIADDAPSGTDSTFANMVSEAIKSTNHNLKVAESVELEAMTGKAELTDLVTAVSSAELSLNTVVAVRDRVINAYNDIIRMAI